MPAYTIKPLVTAIAIGTGGRNGHTETTDHSVSVNLSVRKEMGGPGLPDTTTPEHLFAAGYAACFGGALEFVARQHKKDVKGAVVTCHTSVGRAKEAVSALPSGWKSKFQRCRWMKPSLWSRKRTKRSVRTAMRRAE